MNEIEYQYVEFDKYCNTCVHNIKPESEEPCNECLSNPTNLYANKPVKFEGGEK